MHYLKKKAYRNMLPSPCSYNIVNTYIEINIFEYF